MDGATGLLPKVHCAYRSTISSLCSTPRYTFSSSSSSSKYSVAKPDRLMLPRSPPLPFTHRILRVAPSIGSTWSSFELVFPPPKFVIRRSDPSRFDRYRSNSGESSLAATASSHLSSRNCNFAFAAIVANLRPERVNRPRPSFHTHRRSGNSADEIGEDPPVWMYWRDSRRPHTIEEPMRSLF